MELSGLGGSFGNAIRVNLPALRRTAGLPALPPPVPVRKATIVTYSGNIWTVPIADPEQDLDTGSVWAQIERPGRKAMTAWKGKKLATMSLHVMAGTPARTSVQGDLESIAAIAGMKYPVTIAYGSHSTSPNITESGRWVITDAKIKVKARVPGTNDAAEFEATLELLEANVPTTYVPTEVNEARWGGKTWRVAEGDTLQAIAADVYGDPTRWPEIAAWNQIRDPRKLPPLGSAIMIP